MWRAIMNVVYTTKVVPISIDIYGNQSTTTKTKEV